MRAFWKREAKTAVPLTAISDLRAAQWSGLGQLAREGFERNAVAYRCVRLIAEAAASVGFRGLEGGEALAQLVARPNAEQAGPDLMETFYGHLSVAGDAYLEAVSIDGEVRELFVLRPDRMKPLKGPRGRSIVVAVREPRRLEGVRVGDLVELSYTEGVALTVSPASPRSH